MKINLLQNFNNVKTKFALVFALFIVKQLYSLNSQQYFYGDDSWLLLGSRFDSLIDSLRCCAVSHPIFTIFAQNVFKFLDFSTEKTIVFFLIYSSLLSLLILILPDRLIDNPEKMLVIILIISSPMFIQYGIRTKPYTTDVAISIITIFFFFKIQSSPKKIYFLILGFLLLISISSWPLIGALLLINFIKSIKEKNTNLFINMFYFLPGLFLSIIQLFRWRDEGMQNFVIAYYAPTEGGPYLFIRWLSYSFIRYFGESNKLDLGFFELPLSVSIIVFLVGSIYLIKEKSNFFVFSVIAIFINLLASILKIWPFGGFRSSIYLLPIFCIFFAKGLSYISSFIKNSNFEYLIPLALVIFLFVNLQSPNYEQTTRPFDNEKFRELIFQIDNSQEEFLIYHGGLQTTALYSSSIIELEDIPYFERGRGTEGFHIPTFKKNNLNIGCTKYTGLDNGESCLKDNLAFLETFDGNKITLVGVHIRDHQLTPYLEAFQISGWNIINIDFLNEVAIIDYAK